jgi:ClpP class serine protease
MADMARKAIQQVHDTVFRLLRGNGMEESQARTIAERLSEGRWTHDYPISAGEAREMGLPVSEDMPKEIYTLMDLYPQAGQRRPSVEFIPTPYRPSPGRPS